MILKSPLEEVPGQGEGNFVICSYLFICSVHFIKIAAPFTCYLGHFLRNEKSGKENEEKSLQPYPNDNL